MTKRIMRFCSYLFDGYFLGRAATYAFMQDWKAALLYAVVGLFLTGIDLISIVWDYKNKKEN